MFYSVLSFSPRWCGETEAGPKPALSQYLPQWVLCHWQKNKPKQTRKCLEQRCRVSVRGLSFSVQTSFSCHRVCLTPVPHALQVRVYKKHQSLTTTLSGWWIATATASIKAHMHNTCVGVCVLLRICISIVCCCCDTPSANSSGAGHPARNGRSAVCHPLCLPLLCPSGRQREKWAATHRWEELPVQHKRSEKRKTAKDEDAKKNWVEGDIQRYLWAERCEGKSVCVAGSSY